MKIADIGCGNGGQTITLAQYTGAQITAVDLFPQSLNVLNKKSLELGLQNNIKTVEASMNKLPFEKEEFDIICSEGATYNIGFNRGLQEWKKYFTVSKFHCFCLIYLVNVIVALSLIPFSYF